MDAFVANVVVGIVMFGAFFVLSWLNTDAGVANFAVGLGLSVLVLGIAAIIVSALVGAPGVGSSMPSPTRGDMWLSQFAENLSTAITKRAPVGAWGGAIAGFAAYFLYRRRVRDD